MGKEGILRQAHGIGDTAGAIVRLAAMMGVGVGEDDLHTPAADACACAGTLQPVVVPATDHLNGKLVHVVVVFIGRLVAVERSVALLVEGVAVAVPVFAQTLVATVFHGPHGMLLRLVDIEHLAAIFRLVDIQHLPAADGSSAVWVVGVADLFQFEHVLTRDALVAALIEQNAGIVAVVDDGVAHQFLTLCPARTRHILLGIPGRHGLDQSHTVARLDVLFPWCDMHPAYQITARFHHQVIAIVAQPGRHRDAYTGPLVAGALGIAVHH